MNINLSPRAFILALACGVVLPGFSQLVAPNPSPVIGARMPALSPDGKQLAFVYRGDLWVAPASGGRATALTSHIETDAFPLFSPDGQWVAFSSRRNGNWDIFAVPATGGAARQLTWHAGHEQPTGWSPDGKKILFSARRDAPNYAIHSLDVATLGIEMLAEDFAQLYGPSYSPDGKTIAYGRYGFHWTRPRYTGSAAQQIWVLDTKSRERHALTTNEFQHLWTRWMPDGKHLLTVSVGDETPSSSPMNEVIAPFLDSEERTPNLWTFDLDGRGRQLTHFFGGAVRCPTVAGKSGDIAFEYGPDLWLMKDGKAAPEKIDLFVSADEKQTTRKRERIITGVTEAELSPDGKTFAFGLRGDIWTIPTEKPKGVAGRGAEFAKRLTDWEGDDSDFFWAPDGKKLYFTSDREFSTRLYELDLKSMKPRPLWNRDLNLTGVMTSPDGKQLGFWVSGKDGGLYTLDLDSGESRRIVKLPGPQWNGVGGGDFAWSPDLKWIAYAARSESRAWNIFVVPADGGGVPVNVTRLYAQHREPCWSLDGKYLYFQSDREGSGLYVLPLQKESFRTSDADLKFEKPKTNVVVQIDFEGIQRRIRKFASQSPQNDLTATPEGMLLFISEGDIWSVTYDGKETKRLTTGGGKQALRVAKEGKKVSYIQSGDMYTMSVTGGSGEKVSFTAEFERDVRNERRAAFTQFWSAYNRGFYDPNFHGRNWAAIREKYEPLLEAVETNDEFANLLHTMIGELEASHSEVTPAPGGATPPVTPHLGFAIDYAWAGPGLRVKSVPAAAPGSYARTELRPGDYVLAINGQDVTVGEKLYQILNDKQDRDLEFLVSTNTEKAAARTVKYRALSEADWADLNYRNRTDRLRNYVESRSTNKIGYVHLQAMGANNQTKFEREVYEYMAGKDAMIIDVRFNSGGNIADTLIDWIERKPHGWTRPRDAAPEASPHHAWEKKVIVLMNEHSYSNGEIFPSAMRSRGLAKLVGMPTPGYVIWTSGLSLVDGTGARMPQSGAYRLDGTNEENIGEQPDYLVPLTPDDWLNDRDPQLDKAIELLIEKPGKPAPKIEAKKPDVGG